MGVFDVDYTKITERTDFPFEVEIIEHEWITLSDGVKLSAKLWKPITHGKTKGAVLEYLPYRKDDFTALRDEIRHKYFAGFGYTSIRVDIRGTGDSEGIILDEYPKQEQDDALEVIDWITSQDWSNGSVAMIGKSWGGFNGLQVAARQPEALKTIISLCSTDDRYADDVHYKGGTLMASDMLWWASTMFAYNTRPPMKQFVGDNWREMWLDRLENTPPFVVEWVKHQTRDDYWKHGSVCENYDDIKIPVLTMSGWADGYTNPVFRLMEKLNVPKKAMVGPWAHEFPDLAIPGPQIGYLQEVLEWLDKWMTKEDTEHEDEFLVYVQDSVKPSTSFEYREGKWIDFLNSKTETKDLLESFNGEVNLKNNTHHGLYSGVFCPFGQDGDLPDDQTIDNSLATSILTDKLENDLEIIGQPNFNVKVKSKQAEANIHVRISDVHPTGEKTLITKGQFNLNHFNSHEFPENLELDKFYEVNIPLDVIGYTIPKGHKIEISISPSYWTQVWPSKELEELTVDLSESKLMVPILKEEVLKEPKYKDSETAEPLEKFVHREGKRTRVIEKELTTGEWKLKDFSDEGLRKLKINGITYGTENYNTFTIKENDPLSAHVQCDWNVIVKDDDIDTKVITTSSMYCDLDYFYLDNYLEAYEDDKLVFTKEWNDKIKRNFS